MDSSRFLEKILDECESETRKVLDAGGSIPCNRAGDLVGIVPDRIRQWLEQGSHAAAIDLVMVMLSKILAQKYQISDLEDNAVALMEAANEYD